MNDMGHHHELSVTSLRRRYRRRMKGHMNHPKEAWEVIVDIFLNSVAPDGTPDFDVQTCLPVKFVAGDPHPRIQFDNAGRPGFWIKFRFYDNTNDGAGSGYRFPNHDGDAVWSQLGDTCPSSPVYDVFPKNSLDVQDSGLTLLAFNPNPCPAQEDFRYALNVSTDGKKPYVHLDPGGRNMNGQS
jgi:hypothetical protein